MLILELFAGLVGAVVMVVLVRRFARNSLRRALRRERLSLGIALVGAALAYVVLAYGGAATNWIAAEWIGVPVFGLLALLGYQVSIWYLVFGWLAHIGWDVALHVHSAAPFVPSWMPGFCVGFDIVVAMYLLAHAVNWGPRDQLRDYAR